MSKDNTWTPAQNQAINSLGGTILVSAAAGSGKTTVLVERIIKRLTDPVSPSPVERLLVVTFTKAAAAEMKNRLSNALSKKIKEDPKNAFLKRQKMYLSEAQISTMDSFCQKLVKDNSDLLGISPDFTLMSDSDHQILLGDTADEILEDIYENPDEADLTLLEHFTDGKNDRLLRDILIKIYNISMSDSNPGQWIEKAFEPFFTDCPIEKSVWGEYTLALLRDYICYTISKIDRILLDAVGSGRLEMELTNDLTPVEFLLKEILDCIDSGATWNTVREKLSLLSLSRFATFKADEKDDLFFELKAARRDSLKGDFAKLNSFMVCTSEDHSDDLNYLRPVMSALKKRVIQFTERLSEIKAENNAYYFSDVLHFSLRLLYETNQNGEMKKTGLAKELAGEFDEILIDEFQDTNEAQVSLFNAISKDGSNEFIVGDVKQSIYAFRLASPEIFVSLLDSHNTFDGKNYPAKISLDSNFRSRKGVVDAVNYFFDYLMLPKLGKLDYKKTERLVYGAKGYEEHEESDASVHVLPSENSASNNLENESRYIGNLIKKMIDEKMTVGKEENKRPVKYSDICIILRTVKDKANVMAGILSEMGIPVHYKKEGGFFDNSEIMTVISMLRVIDNPIQDIPLLAVLLSPMTAFTEDDIARIRAENRTCSIYSALKMSEETDGKVKSFLEMLEHFRTLSVTLSVPDLIRRIYEVTSFDCVVSAMNGGDKRALNLQKLTSYAENYSSSGNFGLSGFIRYIDKLQKNSNDLEGAETVSENDNVVRIMTIHKSKGLEFPVVILANLSSKFRKETTEKLLVNKTLGAGALRFVPEENREIKTQVFSSVIAKGEDEATSENLRLLYVAMTRAKEKLIMVGSLYNPEQKIKKLFSENNVDDENIHVAIQNLNSFFSWILLSLIHHPSLSGYDFIKHLPGRTEIPTESKIAFHIAEESEYETVKIEETKQEYSTDKTLIETIDKKVSYVYPYDSLAGLEIKYTASSMDKSYLNEFFASENPSFLSKGLITPAKRGTLIHKFMEVCDFINASKNLNSEIKRAVESGVFTEEEASIIDKSKITAFFGSDMFRRITCADKYLREIEFTMSVPLNEIYSDENIPESEYAVVQGVIDGMILNGKNAEIVDYKTDRVKSAEELCKRYKAQMLMYKKAAEECFGAENVNVTLYSFELSQEISVNFEKNT